MNATHSHSLIVAIFAASCSANDLVGSTVPPYPEHYKYSGGACVSGGRDQKSICDFSIGVLEKNNQLIMYFGKAAPRTDVKQPRWLVTDQMPYPAAPDDSHVVYSMCAQNEVRDETIIAVVKSSNSEFFTEISLAYKVNLDTGRFEQMSTSGLICINESYGLYTPIVEDSKEFSCSPAIIGSDDTITLTKLSPNLRELAVRRPGDDILHFLVVANPPIKMKSLMTPHQLSHSNKVKIQVKHLSGLAWKSDASQEPIFTIDGKYEFYLSSILESEQRRYVCKVKYKSKR